MKLDANTVNESSGLTQMLRDAGLPLSYETYQHLAVFPDDAGRMAGHWKECARMLIVSMIESTVAAELDQADYMRWADDGGNNLD